MVSVTLLKGTAKAAIDAQIAAINAAITAFPDEYPTLEAVEDLLDDYVLATRTIASGLGVLINGGSSATLAGTVTISLNLAAKALAPAIWAAGTDATEAPISPAKLAAAVKALAGAGLKNVRLITASGYVTPSEGVTKWLHIIVDGGMNGTGAASGSTVVSTGGGAGGAGSIGLSDVDDTESYAAVVGAANGGASSLTIDGTTHTSTNGLVNVPQGIPDAASTGGGDRAGRGGNGPFGLGHGSRGGTSSGSSNNGGGASGYGAGGGGVCRTGTTGTLTGGAGTQGCVLILEFG